jgi:heme/copper-type cytochrome/quinol oxidase subunit 4
VLNALLPWKFTTFYTDYAKNPDLYGPFWILATVIAFLFISGNIQRYVSTKKGTKFEYHFNVIPIATCVVYGVGFVLPLLMKLFLNSCGTKERPTPIAQTIGIYGYSFASYLLPVLICAAPVETLQWVIIGYSAIASTIFLVAGFWQDLKSNLSAKWRWLVILLLVLVQITLLLVFKLYFFKHVTAIKEVKEDKTKK